MVESNESINYYCILTIIIFFGGFGGMVSAIFDNFDPESGQSQKTHKCSKCNSEYFFRRASIGTAGAFCAMFFGVWMEKITIVNNTNNLVLLSCFCVTAGLIGFRLLPKIGKKIEERLLEKEINELKDKIDEKSDEGIGYTRVMLHAETALNTKSSGDIDLAINNLLEIRSKYVRDRTLHIYLGRLYRLRGEYDLAIRVLKDFINTIANLNITTVHDSIDKAAAYFNISCYFALKAKKVTAISDEYGKLVNEALEAYKQSVNLSASIVTDAKTDEDLVWLFKEDQRFNEVGE